MTPVKDEGYCHSAYAFSATGCIEGAHFISTGNLVSFSVQQLISCSSYSTRNDGCNSGWPADSFAFWWKIMSPATEEAYPYASGATGIGVYACESQRTNIKVS